MIRGDLGPVFGSWQWTRCGLRLAWKPGNDPTPLAARHRAAADAERKDVEQRSQAAGCALVGILVSDGLWEWRVQYSWSDQEVRRRSELKAMEQRLRNLDAAGE